VPDKTMLLKSSVAVRTAKSTLHFPIVFSSQLNYSMKTQPIGQLYIFFELSN
jgi:hypothetical protein